MRNSESYRLGRYDNKKRAGTEVLAQVKKGKEKRAVLAALYL